MDDQVSGIESCLEELLVARELQRVRHCAVRIREHAVGRYDDVTFNAQDEMPPLFRDGLHHARQRARIDGRQLHALDDLFIVFRKCLHRRLGFDLNHFVAARF